MLDVTFNEITQHDWLLSSLEFYGNAKRQHAYSLLIDKFWEENQRVDFKKAELKQMQ